MQSHVTPSAANWFGLHVETIQSCRDLNGSEMWSEDEHGRSHFPTIYDVESDNDFSMQLGDGSQLDEIRWNSRQS